MNSRALRPPWAVVKKNADVVGCLWVGQRARSDLAQPEQALSASLARALGRATPQTVAAQAKDTTTTVYGATFGSVAETGRRWGHCTRPAGWGLNRQLHAVGDGADWIGLQSQEVFGAQSNFLCDFFHVSE